MTFDKEGLASLLERVRAATMTFDWADLHDDALIPAVPLLREAADAIAALIREKEALERKLAGIETCGCAYDAPGDVCMHHSPALLAAEASLASAREALERVVAADTTPSYRALETVPYRTEIGRAGEIASEAIRALNKDVR